MRKVSASVSAKTLTLTTHFGKFLVDRDANAPQFRVNIIRSLKTG